MAAERPPWRVRYDGACSRCGRSLVRGEPAVYERTSRSIRCIECPTAAEGPGQPHSLPNAHIEAGVAGASARREFERRRAHREERVTGRFGQRLGRGLLAVTNDPQSTRAWERGAEGEELLAETLAGLNGIVALHDRRVPGTRGNIDHIVVAPTGVFVIDAKRYEGAIGIRARGPFLRREARLYVGGRDRSKLADGLAWQVEAVGRALKSAGIDEGVPVFAVLCFIGVQWPLLFPPRAFFGVLLERPRTLRARLTVGGPLPIGQVVATSATLAAAFPVGSGLASG